MRTDGFSLLYAAVSARLEWPGCWKIVLDHEPQNPIFWLICSFNCSRRNAKFEPYSYLLNKIGPEKFIQHCARDLQISPGPYADNDFEMGYLELKKFCSENGLKNEFHNILCSSSYKTFARISIQKNII